LIHITDSCFNWSIIFCITGRQLTNFKYITACEEAANILNDGFGKWPIFGAFHELKINIILLQFVVMMLNLPLYDDYY
jgi:hypothetical protein